MNRKEFLERAVRANLDMDVFDTVRNAPPREKRASYSTCPVCGARASITVHAPSNASVACAECGAASEWAGDFAKGSRVGVGSVRLLRYEIPCGAARGEERRDGEPRDGERESWKKLDRAIYALRYLVDDDLGGPASIERIREAAGDVINAYLELTADELCPRCGIPMQATHHPLCEFRDGTPTPLSDEAVKAALEVLEAGGNVVVSQGYLDEMQRQPVDEDDLAF